MIIYKITNSINGKIYIGLTTRSLSDRKKEHINDSFSRKRELPLHRALRKYGIDNFIFEKIDSALNINDLNKKEIQWIDYYNSTNKTLGYNQKEGGSCGKHLPESIEKIKQAGKKRIFKESTREKLKKNIPPSHKGKKRTPETLKKMSEAQKGRKQAPHVLEAARIANTGRKMSEESKNKISMKLSGRKKPDGIMENLRLNNIGKKRSEETKRKISKSLTGVIYGDNHHSSKLKEKQVIEIKKDLKNGERVCNVARKHNINVSNVKNIKYESSWKHVKI